MGEVIEHPLTPPPEATSTDDVIPSEVLPEVEDKSPEVITPEESATSAAPKIDSTPVSEMEQPTQSTIKEVEVNSSRVDRPIKPLKRSRKAEMNGAVLEPINGIKKVNGETKVPNGTKEDPVVVS